MLHTMFVLVTFFFFKQKTAYEMRISDWSSDVCSSDLASAGNHALLELAGRETERKSEKHRAHGVGCDDGGRHPGARQCRIERPRPDARRHLGRASETRHRAYQGPVGPKLRFWPSRRTFWERGIRY